MVHSLFSKLLELLGDGSHQDSEHFRKKILTYSITRVLPSLSSDDFAQDSSILQPNLVHLYNFYDMLQSIVPDKKEYKTVRELLSDRTEYLLGAIR